MAELYDQLAAQNPEGQFYRIDVEEVRDVSLALDVRNVSLATLRESGTHDCARSAARI